MIAEQQLWRYTLFREYTILYDMFQSSRSDDFIQASHDGFEVRNFSVLEDSAKILDINIASYMRCASDNEFVYIELARDNYKDAMKHFSHTLLRDAYFLFVESDVETCIERIHHRVTHAQTSRHFVPDHILRGYYAQDNIEYMQTFFKEDYYISTNIKAILNNGSLKNFEEEIQSFACAILTRENNKVPE